MNNTPQGADSPTLGHKTSKTKLLSARLWKVKNPELNKKINDQRNAAVRSDPIAWQKKLEANRESARRNRAKRSEYDRQRDWQKVKARNRVRHLIRTGKLFRQSCEKCGNPITDAHHDDYSKPLEIKWLCRKHHKELHDEKH